MKLKRIIPGAIAALVAFTGCVSDEQKQENARNEKQASKNAIKYIEEKYGFTASVLRSEAERTVGLFGPSFTGDVFVDMMYEDKEFTVMIDGECENTDGEDDYQSAEIIADLERKIESAVGGEVEEIFIKNFYNQNTSYKLLYNTRYDGSNLDELVSEHVFDCIVRMEDSAQLRAVDSADMEELFCGGNGTLFTGNGKNDGQFDDLSVLLTDIVYGQLAYKYAMYLNETVSLTWDDGYSYLAPEVSRCGDMYYLSDGEPVMVSETAPDDASNWDGHGSSDGKICSGAYAISRTDDSVWVYFKRNSLPENGERCAISTSWLTSEGVRRYFGGSLTYTVGDYIVKELEPDSDGFYCTVIHNND